MRFLVRDVAEDQGARGARAAHGLQEVPGNKA